MYRAFSLNIYEYPKYQQHQSYYNQLKNHINIPNPVAFMLPTEKSFEAFPKHNGFASISESLALNLYISTLLANI